MEGMRKGEICAVKWRMIDLDCGTVAVSRSIEQRKPVPRDKIEELTVPNPHALAEFHPRVLLHKARQAEELLQAWDPADPESPRRREGERKPAAAPFRDARMAPLRVLKLATAQARVDEAQHSALERPAKSSSNSRSK